MCYSWNLSCNLFLNLIRVILINMDVKRIVALAFVLLIPMFVGFLYLML